MARYKAMVVAAVVAALGMVELQQIAAACRCVCHGVTGLPETVDVTNATGGCDTEFTYTYKVHFATNDDDCGSGITGYAVAYPSGSYSVNLVTEGDTRHRISPNTFTISGAGTTQPFVVTGQLRDQCLDGVSATQVYEPNLDCDTGILDVDIIRDSDCICP